MGQGYSLTTLSAGAAGIDVPELSDFTVEKSLGHARFMKCIRARHKDGLVVAKVVMKPFPAFKLDRHVRNLVSERKQLSEIPNALGFHRIFETSTSGYLVRQFIHSSLYDRLSTRPFLEHIEKKWLAFQLLCAVRDCHARNVYHGDIKTENILVTSWNWLYLTDFSSSFKPTYLPDNNPADFNFFFDTSGRRTCYLAPERFLGPGDNASGKGGINWAMDVFSVGCVIAELFLEVPIFNLGQLFNYRASEGYDPKYTLLNKITDSDIREMVEHMIQVDPQDRLSAEEYLNFWKRRAFPEYFYSFLHQYMHLITDPTSGQRPITAGNENLGESDERIDRVFFDFDKISYFLGYSEDTPQIISDANALSARGDLFPLHIDIPNHRHEVSSTLTPGSDDGTLIFLSLVVASLRSTARATARIRACELLLAFSERVTDEAKMDRILPYLVVLLGSDQSDSVRVAAIRTITQMLNLVTVVSPVNSNMFQEYLIARLSPLVYGHSSKPSAWVRATYASCIGTLAKTAEKFLNMMQALRCDGTLQITDTEIEHNPISSSVYQRFYDDARDDLVALFESQAKAILTDPDVSVRRAALSSVGQLCTFFGSPKSNDVILSHLNTYLNDRDWLLKGAFFETVVGVATYVGTGGLEGYILPLLVQALTDPEESVVERVIRAFSSLAELGLFHRTMLWELVSIVARFTMHPNIWIREAAAHFLAASAKFSSPADKYSILTPLIKPYLKVCPVDINEVSILTNLKKPFSRMLMEMAANWVLQTEKGIFWKNIQKHRSFIFGNENSIPDLSKVLGREALSQIPKHKEDEVWLTKLRNAAMHADDEFKLVALGEYIFRTSMKRHTEKAEVKPLPFGGLIKVKDLGIAGQTVFFDHNQDAQAPIPHPSAGQPPQTLAEALEDATKPTSNGLENRRLSLRSQKSVQEDGPAVQESSARRPSNVDRVSLLKSPVPEQVTRKGSAMDLLGKGDTRSKAVSETSTANAFGEVDGSKGKELKRNATDRPVKDDLSRKSTAKFKVGHSYQGHDPSVLRLLDSLYFENHPSDYVHFGPMVNPLNRRRPISKASGQTPANGHWKPDGILVALLNEHTAAVNRIAVSPDHAFFVTGSNDGTVKVWDTARLERNITHRSRQTHYHGPKVRVTSLVFIEDTYCFVSTGSDGSVHVVKVDSFVSQGATKYNKLKLVREYQLPTGQHAVWAEHHRVDNQSLLVLITNTSHIISLELRAMKVQFTLHNPTQHGSPTCFCIDRKHQWLLLGTTHGVLDLWDLRFRIRLKSWLFPAGLPIHRVSLYPSIRGSKKHTITVAGGSPRDITVFNLEKSILREVYRASEPPRQNNNPSSFADNHARSEPSTPSRRSAPAPVPTLLDLDDPLANRPSTSAAPATSGGFLTRFAGAYPATSRSNAATPAPSSASGASGATSFGKSPLTPLPVPSPSSAPPPPDTSVRALVVGVHFLEENADTPKHFFMLGAGPDWRVRFWDCRGEAAGTAAGSGVVCGLGPEEVPPTYAVDARGKDAVLVVEEIRGSGAEEEVLAELEGEGRDKDVRGTRGGAGGTSSAGAATRGKLASWRNQGLMRGHRDVVTDVALLEWPYGMVVSGDRAGCVYVWA